jgi:hypothetical protein
MKLRFVVLVLVLAASALWLVGGVDPRPVMAAAPAAGSCTFPTALTGSVEQTAWQLFVAANCPTNKNQVVWENWIEQSNFYPAGAGLKSAKPRRLHGSPLAQALARKAGLTAELSPSTDCNTMGGPPSNVVPGATICEEARINPSAQSYMLSQGFQLRAGQVKAAQASTNIQFPTPAVEVKVDWIPGTDFNPPFTCAKPPQGVHVESIDGVCYAMAGMHIESKLITNWIWATFEPQNLQTNPNRCITFGSCIDSWGSAPPVSNGGAGGFTKLTPALQTLMTSAKLAPEFLNYRMDGVQNTFVTTSGAPTLLGNSIIEGENVGMTKGTASCITCHSVSSIKTDGTDGITVLGAMPTPPVGPQYVIPKGWIARDFVWSMMLACPGSPTGRCSAVAPAKKEKPKVK